jgi:hypothetical protein
MTTAMRQLGRPLGKLLAYADLRMKTSMTRVIKQSRIMLTTKALRPLRTAGAGRPGGLGGAAPASLDLYGQSSTEEHHGTVRHL